MDIASLSVSDIARIMDPELAEKLDKYTAEGKTPDFASNLEAVKLLTLARRIWVYANKE